ncbi:hypothetical protein J7624_00145 [Wohlfahrtiimonas chitiniclastica]|uniref:hypothetical protein n=1 Tax=Wohlfahrtiimonas chitiniclastica TaxID=400946 RepID=UPI001BCB3224|nr:hypothetical protein [Wohlfahrtiimonas chitiniclastica]MBS7818789.1 hypothetical protein [Wohlfahrtiimonas chitiniclastica]MBS7825560.1 hypothetical protein [Wohlfahrtiimonas chitiniclastica]
MNANIAKRKNQLHLGARLALFFISYLPLFLIMSLTQFYTHKEYLHWAGLSYESIYIFVKFFLFAIMLVLLSILSIIGLYVFLKNIKRRCRTSGRTVKIVEIENKNSDSISYLFTYLIPFVFQDLSVLMQAVSIIILLFVTALIYINSNMILINPVLSMKYTLYQVTYIDIESNNKRTGLILTEVRYLEEGDLLDIESLGSKLFYAEALKEN